MNRHLFAKWLLMKLLFGGMGLVHADQVVLQPVFSIDACTFNYSFFQIDVKHGHAYKCTLNANGRAITYYAMRDALYCNADGPGLAEKNECSGTSGRSPTNISIPRADLEICKTFISIEKLDNRTGAGWYIDKWVGTSTFGIHHWVNSRSLRFEGGQEVSVRWTHVLTPTADREIFREKIGCDFKTFDSVGGCLFDNLCSDDAIRRGFPTQ